MVKKQTSALHQHLIAVKQGKRCFENAFQGVARMILESKIDKVVVNGKTTYDFSLFRTGKKHIIGALANRTNEENQKLYDRMVDTMLNKLGYCRTCAQKTIEYFCTQEDET